MLKSQIVGAAYMNMPSLQEMDNNSELAKNSLHSSSTVNYITFNQDSSFMALGLSDGYKLYSCKPRIIECVNSMKNQSIGIVEMLYRTPLVAVVPQGDEPGSSPRKLKILNSKKLTTICELMFPSTILSVKFSYQRMVVVLEEQIYIYDVTNMTLLHTIETSPNVNRLCTISNSSTVEDPSILAYPSPPRTIIHESLLVNGLNTNGGSNSAQNNIQSVSKAPNRIGDAIIFDLNSLQPLAVIEAHKSALSAMCLSRDGSLLATASDKGTIIRVFNVQTGSKLYQFRRGTYPTKIYSISFSNENKYIVATSASETVHIFRLGEEELLANKQRQKRESKNRRNIYIDRQTIEEEHEIATSLSARPLKYTTERGKNEGFIEANDDDVDGLEDEDEDDEGIIEDDGDDSDVEGECDDNVNDLPIKQRKMSQSSLNSYNSLTSGQSNISGTEEPRDRNDPIVDQNRLSVARLIRRSSQNLGRKAAQKMGDFLPTRFSSILEPTRHFASVKIQSMGKDVKSFAVLDDEIRSVAGLDNQENELCPISSSNSSQSNKELNQTRLIHINVVTSEGYFYTYGLDPERGGDCILLHQYFLLND